MTRKHQLSWHFTQKTIQQSVTRDTRAWFELADGSWLQETRANQDAREPSPAVWTHQKKRWNHLLRLLAVSDFQMTFSQVWSFLYEPRTQALPPQREWSFSWTLPSRGLGPLLGSMSFRQGAPPTEFISDYLAELHQVPVLGKTEPSQATIFFDGRLLLHFLGNSIHHLEKHTNGKGTWRRRPHKEDLPPDRIKPFPSETETTAQPLPSPLLPRESAYYPHETLDAVPANNWRALFYDSDRRTLVCRNRNQGENQFKKWHLPQPLYRLFPDLHFLSNRRDMVIRKCLTSIPDAVLSLHSLEKA